MTTSENKVRLIAKTLAGQYFEGMALYGGGESGEFEAACESKEFIKAATVLLGKVDAIEPSIDFKKFKLGSRWIHCDPVFNYGLSVKVIYHDKKENGVVVENVSGSVIGIWNDTDYLFVSSNDHLAEYRP